MYLCNSEVRAQIPCVGEEDASTLKVPSVSPGYVDKAIWTCSNSSIIFVDKSTTSATVKATRPFDGTATIELLYVQKYVDSKGFTRSITYTKNYYVRYKYKENGNAQKIPTELVVEPQIRVALGEKAKIKYSFVPEGSSADIYTSLNPQNYFNGIVNHPDGNYLEGWARAAGETSVQIYFYDKNKKCISTYCSVTVYDPSWTIPQSISITPVMLLKKGDEKRLFAKMTPANANTFMRWYGGKYSIATINNGIVLARGTGITNVNVKTSEGLLGRSTIVVVDDESYIAGMKKAINRAANAIEKSEMEIVK